MPNWGHVLNEINAQNQKVAPDSTESAADIVRQRYLMQLHQHTGRNVICYYSGWLSKPRIEGIDINDEDKNGFMLAIHRLDRKKGLDLVIHTPGGNLAATESLVHYIREMFGRDVRAFVPQLAMSAGTMIACSCRQIFMGKHSNLGPVDPQINGIAAYAVVKELENAYQQIVADQQRAFIWTPILSRYTPGFVQLCEWGIQRAKDMVAEFLRSNMFADLEPAEREQRVARIIERLTAESSDKGHDRHIHADECKEIGLEINNLEDPKDKKLQDLVLTVHHCFMFTLSNTQAFKIIENHTGKRYVKLTNYFIQQIPGIVPGVVQQPHADTIDTSLR